MVANRTLSFEKLPYMVFVYRLVTPGILAAKEKFRFDHALWLCNAFRDFLFVLFIPRGQQCALTAQFSPKLMVS